MLNVQDLNFHSILGSVHVIPYDINAGFDPAGGLHHISSFAAQCLHNAIYLSDQSLLQASTHTPPSQADTLPESHASHDAQSNPNGLLYPSNGHRGRIAASRGAVGEGSAAEAAEQLAMLSLDRSRASSGKVVEVRVKLMQLKTPKYLRVNPCQPCFLSLFASLLRALVSCSCNQHSLAQISGMASASPAPCA